MATNGSKRRTQTKRAEPAAPKETRKTLEVEVAGNMIYVRHQGLSQHESPTVLRLAAKIVEQQLGIRE
jgi:hypothetical protein